MRACPRRVIGVLGMALAALTACGEPTAPEAGDRVPAASGALLSGKLVTCPIKTTRSVSALLGPLGGTLSLDGTSVTLPAGAVTVPTLLTLTIPASNYVEVEITANGLEHFLFELPVAVSIGYGRCTRSDIDAAPLTAWYIDGATNALLEHMGGVDDKASRTVTFSTGHLSSYAIAY